MFTSREVAEIVSELRGGIALLFPQDNIEAILFGSYARGDADSESDIEQVCIQQITGQEFFSCPVIIFYLLMLLRD